MSIRIISSGILDTIQDTGRYGYQHLGIGEGGAMDRFSACLANALLGRQLHAPVMELHFPAPALVCVLKLLSQGSISGCWNMEI